MAARTWPWREGPILEAVLRLRRAGRAGTPDAIADEAILHLDDVREGIAALVTAGYLDSLEVETVDGRTARHVAPTFVLDDLLRARPHPAPAAVVSAEPGPAPVEPSPGVVGGG